MYSNSTSTPVYTQQTSSSLDEILLGLGMFSGILAFITIVFFIIAILYAIRLWMVQTATFEIRKDLKEIRDWMAWQSQQAPDPESSDSQGPTGPSQQETTEDTQHKSITLGKPRKSFLLITGGATAAVLIAVILYINLG